MNLCEDNLVKPKGKKRKHVIDIENKRIKKIRFKNKNEETNFFNDYQNINEIDNQLFILTGRNGSGKTKFLELLKECCLDNRLLFMADFKQFDSKIFKSLPSNEYYRYDIREFLSRKIEEIEGILKSNETIQVKVEEIDKKIRINKTEKIDDLNYLKNIVEIEVKKYESESKKIVYGKLLASYLIIVEQYKDKTENFNRYNPQNIVMEIAQHIAEFKHYFESNIFLENLTDDEVSQLKQISNIKDKIQEWEKAIEIEKIPFEKIKKDYYTEIKREVINDLVKNYEKFIDPLEYINKDLEKFSLQLKLDENNSKILINKINEIISPNITPSSGEQFIINLYCIKYLYAKFLPVSVILMDEPDRHLEPKLIEIFFDVIKDFTKLDSPIQIFFTTHRPDTISLANKTYPDSIWTIDSEKKKIAKCHYLNALFKLTYNLRDIMNFKIKVYVESHIDFKFYEIMYKILLKYSNKIREKNFQNQEWNKKKESIEFKDNRILSRRYQLEFCSSAKTLTGGQGGKYPLLDFLKRELSSIDFQIKELKDENLKNDLKLFKPYGLRDKDDGKLENSYKNEFYKNPDLKKRIVFTKRYSLENYLYDPILICSLFDDNFFDTNNLQFLKDIKSSIKTESRPNYSILINKLEEFKDIKEKMEKILKDKDENELDNSYIRILNDKAPVEIKYPEILNILRGHDVEKAFENIYSNGLVKMIEDKLTKFEEKFKNVKKEIKDKKEIYTKSLYEYALSIKGSSEKDKLNKTFNEVFRKLLNFFFKDYTKKKEKDKEIDVFLIKKFFEKNTDYFSAETTFGNLILTNISNLPRLFQQDDQIIIKQKIFKKDEFGELNIETNDNLKFIFSKLVLKTSENDFKTIVTNFKLDNLIDYFLRNDLDTDNFPKIFQIWENENFEEQQKKRFSNNFFVSKQTESIDRRTLGEEIIKKLSEIKDNIFNSDNSDIFYFPYDLAETFFDLNVKVRNQIRKVIKPKSIESQKQLAIEWHLNKKKELKEGDKWYLINAEWFEKWLSYIGIGIKIENGQTEFHERESSNQLPGKISNQSIIQKDPNKHCYTLKKNLDEGKNFFSVSEELWQCFVEVYGLESKNDTIKRFVKNESGCLKLDY